mmetsp:Transcript_21790/g.65168  ORF Transcript_21790/g.65168 Transcript_21790/m.65168 type:complete len:122 (-) Transcript_21790:625-990(-)
MQQRTADATAPGQCSAYAVQNCRRCIYALIPEAHAPLVEFALKSPLFASVVSSSTLFGAGGGGRFATREIHHEDIELSMELPSFVPRAQRKSPFNATAKDMQFFMQDSCERRCTSRKKTRS